MNNTEIFCSFCRKAVAHPEVFQTFKRHPIYTLFSKTLTEIEGIHLLNKVKTLAPEFLEKLEVIRAMDRLGGAILYEFDSVGPLSLNTIWFLSIAADLKQYFPNVKDIRVIEIGTGDSGILCKVIHEFFSVKEYTIVDIADALELTKLHLKELGITNVKFITPEKVKKQTCDLLLSSDSFTELNSCLQKKYLKCLFSQAQKGYLTCNFYPLFFMVKPLSKEQLVKKMIRLHPNSTFNSSGCLDRKEKENFFFLWKDL